ncbi:MAG: hypothetical protein KDK45_16815 [Leptospiraceae bacterium]|nr:hypothetical protein [Leptospiraceae bacterium]
MWEEIYLSNKTKSSPIILEEPEETIETKPKETGMSPDQVLELKSRLKEEISGISTGFQAVGFIDTSLTGRLDYKNNADSVLSNPEQEELYTSICEELISFYKDSFLDDSEILDYLGNYLLRKDCFSEYLELCETFDSHAVLPIEHEMFLSIIGRYENKIKEEFLKAIEQDVLKILYKFKNFSINRAEKDFLYDKVISGEYANLLGLVFQLFRNEFEGPRNIYPLYAKIQTQFSHLSEEEKGVFLASFKKSGQYLNIYFLLKQLESKEGVRAWLEKEKEKNGKIERHSLPEVNLSQPTQLKNRVKLLKKDNSLYFLQPFEILLLLNSTESFLIRESLLESYRKQPFSYIINRSIAVVYFFDNDFYKFLHHASLSGRFKFQAEMLYIKALVLLELGKQEEGKVILSALQTRFPRSQFLKSALDEYKLEE